MSLSAGGPRGSKSAPKPQLEGGDGDVDSRAHMPQAVRGGTKEIVVASGRRVEVLPVDESDRCS